MADGISLKEHFEALREEDRRAVDLVREWVQERLESHNGLLKQWRDATEKDRESYARKDDLKSLEREFAIYKEITAKALTLAEGKRSGVDAVRVSITFVAGIIVAAIAFWGVTQGLR